MQVIGQISTGNCVWTGGIVNKAGARWWPSPEKALDIVARKLPPDDLAAYEIEDDDLAFQLANTKPGEIVLTWDSDQIIDVQPPAPAPYLYVHITVTGGIQSPSGTLYLRNDGLDALAVHAELRDGPELATSNAVTQLGGQDINGLWALELVNVDTGALADTPLVQMTAGVINVSYTTTIAPCEVELAEERFEMIGSFEVKLAQPVRLKIVRALS